MTGKLLYEYNTFKAIPDTTFFERDNSEEMITDFVNSCDGQCSVIIPLSVYKELERKGGVPEYIDRLLMEEKAYIAKDNNTLRTDDDILHVVINHRRTFRLMVLTQDANLAKDIVALNRVRHYTNTVIVRRVDAEGNIGKFSFLDSDEAKANDGKYQNVLEKFNKVRRNIND